MRQRRWMELVKDYDCEILYHPGKANVIADALSRKERIKEAQKQDPELIKTRARVSAGKASDFSVDETGMLRFGNRICVPMDENIKKEIMDESHTTPYSVHPGSTKMYQDLKAMFWWPGMKNDIAEYVARFTKSAHFLPVQTNFSIDQYAELYVREIVRLHGVPKSIVSDRDPKFTSRF
ncbi:hypothetical protein CsatB_028688 [Cannabis sativa]